MRALVVRRQRDAKTFTAMTLISRCVFVVVTNVLTLLFVRETHCECVGTQNYYEYSSLDLHDTIYRYE